ncbi:MAG: DNA replication and repair protein RecF [Rhodothermales bacterium]|jgi:DNA replication and repair protein RecF
MAILSEIRLHDFRNYERLRLPLTPGITVLLGDNGQGKTSILEAIYFLSLLRSFRTHKPRHLSRWGQGEFTLHGVLQAENHEQRLAVRHGGDSRVLRHNGEPVARASDFIRQFFCVAFVPDDLGLMQGAGSERRRFLDIQLCQLCPSYLAAAQNYAKALKSRNSLLRREHSDTRAIAAFDSVLVPYGQQIIQRRDEYAAALSGEVGRLAPQMFAESCELRIRYRPSAKSEALADALEQHRDRDIQRRQTQVGPHRDELVITLDGKSLSHFGSEGQCRLAALVLKMAAARLLSAADGDQPTMLLVDDVIGELDDGRRDAFFAALRPASQVCFACTSADVAESLAPATIIDVREGQALERGE